MRAGGLQEQPQGLVLLAPVPPGGVAAHGEDSGAKSGFQPLVCMECRKRV